MVRANRLRSSVLWRVGLLLLALVIGPGHAATCLAVPSHDTVPHMLLLCNPYVLACTLACAVALLLLRFPKLSITGVEPKPNIMIIGHDRTAMVMFQWVNLVVTFLLTLMVLVVVLPGLPAVYDKFGVLYFLVLQRGVLKIAQDLHRFITRNLIIKGIRRFLIWQRGYALDPQGRIQRRPSCVRDPVTGICEDDWMIWSAPTWVDPEAPRVQADSGRPMSARAPDVRDALPTADSPFRRRTRV